jgi:ATP-dependent RNA helicase RhlB
VNTKAFVERVARALEKGGYRVGVLSGDVPQKKRETLLNRFQKGQLEILVATDVAARGLHIDGVSHVYNYDLPFDAEDYVHRIGRTARLGAEGDAISFACERYAMSLPDIEAYIEQKLPVAAVEADLLVAVPRPPREVPEGAEGEAEGENESIGAIFKEAREQRAADEERRGGGRSRTGKPGGGGRGESRGGRREGSRSEGSRDGAPRGERKPRPQPVADPAAQAHQAVEAAMPSGDADRAPRKRRRRRGGRRIEGADAAQAAAPAQTGPKSPTQVHAQKVQGKAPVKDGDKLGLLHRIGRGLKSLISRSPRSQH